MSEAMAMRVQRSRAESFRDHNSSLFDAQKRARRGPTPEVFFTKHLDNSRLVKADDPERRREMRSFSVMMAVFFCFVMTYVWQHFSSIDTGYRIEATKQQVERLREDNRQLHLTEAQLVDPERIDKIATELGMSMPAPGQVIRTNADTNGPVLAQMQPAAANIVQ